MRKFFRSMLADKSLSAVVICCCVLLLIFTVTMLVYGNQISDSYRATQAVPKTISLPPGKKLVMSHSVSKSSQIWIITYDSDGTLVFDENWVTLGPENKVAHLTSTTTSEIEFSWTTSVLTATDDGNGNAVITYPTGYPATFKMNDYG